MRRFAPVPDSDAESKGHGKRAVSGRARQPLRSVYPTRARGGALILAVLASNLGPVGCGRARASPPADSAGVTGIVLYTGDATGDSEIFALDVVSGRTWNVTCSPGSQDGDAALSPTKDRIAFASDRGGAFEIYTMRLDGSEVVQVTHNGTYSAHPTWSPDGKRLAFQTGPVGAWDIAIVRADGSDQRVVTSHPASDYHPVWSPDGRRIAFESARDGPPNLFTYDVETGELRQLTHDTGSNQQAAWSPDGSRILFNSDRDTGETSFDLYVMHADGTGVQRLTTFPGHDEFGIWSPDGAHIAFMVGDNAGDQIAIMNADGSDRRVVTSGPGVKTPDVWYLSASTQQIPRSCN